MQDYKILIVDNHPYASQAFKSIAVNLALKDGGLKFAIDASLDYHDACNTINNGIKESLFYDIAIVAIESPDHIRTNIETGRDVCKLIRKNRLSTKIIILTSIDSNYLLLEILQNFGPEGFLVKKELTDSELETTILAVIQNQTFYGKTITSLLKRERELDLGIDMIDRNILYQLSLGKSTKKLSEEIYLSSSAIEKRKRKMAKNFGLDSTNTKKLIHNALEQKII